MWAIEAGAADPSLRDDVWWQGWTPSVAEEGGSTDQMIRPGVLAEECRALHQ